MPARKSAKKHKKYVKRKIRKNVVARDRKKKTAKSDIRRIDMKLIEKRWQKKWAAKRVYEAEPDRREKFFVTFPYPYINSSPHAGHAFSALKCDMVARYKKMRGFNVLFPLGLHATGEPIVGAAKRVAKGDKAQIEAFKACGLSMREIQKMKDPVHIVEFFRKEWINDFHELGMAVDWRRTFYTTELNKAYNNFVTWQYLRLREMGLVAQGSHPVIWCPECKSPTGSHDRKEGENANVIDYIMIKFILEDGEMIPCATLRPETVYGVTNIWVKPDIEYVEVDVTRGAEKEKWIVSEDCVTKLRDQKYDVRVSRRIHGSKLVGKYVRNPLTDTLVPVLPASFVKPEDATGVVMSVPSHAPYDWAALREMKSSGSDELRSIAEKIEPINLIDTPGMPAMPGVKLTEDAGIEHQDDPRLESLTKQIYRAEFHKGVLNSNCHEFSKMTVRGCKEALTERFIKYGFADMIYETTEPVVCRCLTKCHVKIIENQWFIRYSDPVWKERTLLCLDKCKVWPEEAKTWMKNAIIGVKDKACARHSGLGTPIPWDRGWIIEPLSDSTIYMSFYIIASYVNSGKIADKHLTVEFFDYVYLGKGELSDVAKSTKLDAKLIERVRRDFMYWYPVDLRSSGKDLLSHHLIFFLYHHTAFFPEKLWPRGIGANGWVAVDGDKMSKSKGNFVTLKTALNIYGADASRMAFLDSGVGLDDVDFRRESAKQYRSKMEEFLRVVPSMIRKARLKKQRNIDIWLVSRIQSHIETTTKALENLENSTALQSAFWQMYNDINRYVSRTEPEQGTIRYSLGMFARLVSPFAPHFAEELWSMLGDKNENRGLCCEQKWPEPDEDKRDPKIEQLEQSVDKTLEDIRQVLQLVQKGREEAMKNLETIQKGREKWEKTIRNMQKIYLYVIPFELDTFKETSSAIQKMFNMIPVIYSVDDPNKYDPKDKAKKAKPGKPGIFIE